MSFSSLHVTTRHTTHSCRPNFVATIVGPNFARQIFVEKKVLFRKKYFVTTNIILSRQAYFWRSKRRVFVATKMILRAAPANDK